MGGVTCRIYRNQTYYRVNNTFEMGEHLRWKKGGLGGGRCSGSYVIKETI